MISHHEQRFYESATELLTRERTLLSALIGHQIDQIWIAAEPDGSWFNDEPAVVVLGDRQLEIAVYQVGLLAITWNTIDLSTPPNWLGCWSDAVVACWTPATLPPFRNAIGQRIVSLHIADDDSGANAVQFQLESGFLVLHNALDELGVSDDALGETDVELHPVAT